MENTNQNELNENEVQQENKTLKIVKVVVNVIFYVLIFMLLLFSIANLNKKDEFSVPSIFGKGFTTVQTDSMAGSEKDSFTTKDLVFVSVVNDHNRAKKLAKLEKGDIITFKTWNSTLGSYMLNTHRIFEIVYNADGSVAYYITKGDNPVSNPVPDDDPVYAEDIRGIYTGKWVGAGATFKFLQTSTGFLVCIVLPVAIFFIVELVLFILQLNKIKRLKDNEKHEEEMAKLKEEQAAKLEEEKARIRAEILAEQEAARKAEQTEESKEEEKPEE